jgi:hypothetical protein
LSSSSTSDWYKEAAVSNVSGKLGVLAGVVILAAVSVLVMTLLDWHVAGTDEDQGLLGLDLDLWLIFWTLTLTGYWGLPGSDVPVLRKAIGTVVIIALGVVFTYIFKWISPGIVGGDVDTYPLMSLTFIAWNLVFVMTALWIGSFYQKI